MLERNLLIARARVIVECSFAAVAGLWRAANRARPGEKVDKLGKRWYVCALLTNRLWRVRDSYPRNVAWLRKHQTGSPTDSIVTLLSQGDSDERAEATHERALRRLRAQLAREMKADVEGAAVDE